MRMHHIGLVVKSIEAEARLYEFLGYEPTGAVVADDFQSNRILFMRNNQSGETIELIEPINEKSSVHNLPKGYAHICYETENLDELLESFKSNKIGIVFTEKLKAPALDGKTIVFAYMKNKTIVEFLEIKGR